MKKLLTFLLMLSASVVYAGDSRTLVINDSGYYLMITPQTAAPYFEKIDVVIDVTSNGQTPTDPQEPDTPDEDPIVKEAERMAQSIGNKKDAEIVAAAYLFFSDKLASGEMDKSGFETAFKVARRIAGRRLEEDWSPAWKVFDEGMEKTNDLPSYLAKISEGLSNYANVESSELLNSEREDATGAEILLIIEAIVQLLKLLGVLK